MKESMRCTLPDGGKIPRRSERDVIPSFTSSLRLQNHLYEPRAWKISP